MSTMNAQPVQQTFHEMPPQQYMQPQHPDTILLQQLKSQIEFYFCPQNLEKDKYLQSQLSATEHLGAVPIGVICNFPKVRQLYALARMGQHVPAAMAPPADPVVLRIALYGSHVVSVSADGLWMTPKYIPEFRSVESFEKEEPTHDAAATVATSATTVASAPSSPSSQATGSSSLGVPTHSFPLKERNTVIVRDLPECVTAEQVVEAFSEGEITPKTAIPDVGQTWYVTFESEEQAVRALSATRDRKIAGAPICGRLRNELLQKEHPQPPAIPLVTPAQDASPMPPNLRPRHTQAHYSSANGIPQQYRPAMHLPPVYGYVPYPYGMPMQHSQQFSMAFQMQQQQRLQQSYAYQQQVRASSRTPQHVQGYSAPPPHVYVRPNTHTNQNQDQNQNGKKNNKKKQTRNNSNNQYNSFKQQGNRNGGNQETENNTEVKQAQNPQPQPQDQDQDQKNNIGISVTSPTEGGDKGNGTGKNRVRNKKGWGNKNNSDNLVELSAKHFPVLGGQNAKPSRKAVPRSNASVSGYAKALLKQPTPSASALSSKSNSPTNEQALEEAMNKLALSETAAAASYEEW